MTRVGMTAALCAMVLFAMGSPALAAPPTTVGNTGNNGPTIPKLGDPVATVSEVQWVTVTVGGGTPSGTFTLNGSAAIAFNASASAVRTAVGALFGGTSNIAVVGGPVSANFDSSGAYTGSWYYRITWVGAQAGNDVALLTADGSGLTNATVTVDPYQDGQVIASSRNVPHGGFSATTDYCLQCHSVHQAPGEGYGLLANASVTATCKTCHGLMGASATGAGNPGFPGVEAPTSLRTAYEVTGAAKLAAHNIGATGIPFSTVAGLTESGWSYGGFSATGWSSSEPAGAGTASDTDGGLYCGDCHTPHGDFGQLVNSKYYRSTAPTGSPSDLSTVYNWTEGARIYYGGGSASNIKELHYDSANKVWQACTSASTQTGCVNLTTTDSEGESAYLYGYKLLSAYPNHSWNAGPQSWNMDKYTHDGAKWCGACHDKAVPSEYGGTFHNHPTGCTTCHGVPNDGTSTDFPHTSTFQNFLKDYPDLLCINCHTSGSLP